MTKRLLVLYVFLLGCLILTPFAKADDFVNGGFESGTLTGWTQGGGSWTGGSEIPSSYLPGGANYATPNNYIVTPGTDPISGLSTVYNGSYAAKVNDSYQNYSVSVLSQTVKGYTNSNIYFAWAAVLEGSHGLTDSDNFTLQLTDDTKGSDLYNVSYNSASAAGTSLFTETSSGWYYTAWQVEQLDIPEGDLGDDITLTLLASDCPYGGHAGYVYLDGFGAAPPPPVGPGVVPEPSSLWLLGSGLALVAKRFVRR